MNQFHVDTLVTWIAPFGFVTLSRSSKTLTMARGPARKYRVKRFKNSYGEPVNARAPTSRLPSE